jgi:hypothetical protein
MFQELHRVLPLAPLSYFSYHWILIQEEDSVKIALATVLEISFPRVAKRLAIVTVWLLELEADGAISDAMVFIAVVKAELVELVAISSVGLLVSGGCMRTSSTLLFVVGCGRMAATFPEAVAVSSPELEESVRFMCLCSPLRAICTPGLVANKVKLRIRVMHKTLVL